ncbi:hypothetical protein JCM11641_002319 [Rhodosporidiobolus odoratus]
MSTPRAVHSGLYALQLPSSLLPTLTPRKLVIPQSHPLHPNQRPSTRPDPTQEPQSDADQAHQQAESGAAYRCALTGASFDSIQALRQHYRTDWYRYNVKLRLKGQKTPVGEDEFNQRIQDLSDSLSGSGSSDSDSDASSSSASLVSGSGNNDKDDLSRLLARHTVISPSGGGTAGEEVEDYASGGAGPRSALLWFEAPQEEGREPTQYGVYRAILPKVGGEKRSSPTEGEDALAELKALQIPEKEKEGEGEERKYTLLMFGGGHFAGMVVRLGPRMVGKGKGKEKEREVVVLERKTFHRYTTRRKQGGGQGANDNANGKAKSMGAQLRRHNEAALTDEVRELLSSWQADIDSSELVFLRCSKNNYKTFFGYDDAVLQRGDSRMRGFTFPTRRPTIAELLRSFLELTRVKTTHLTAEALAQLDADYLSSIAPRPAPAPAATSAPPPKKPVKPEGPKLTKQEELERDRWARLVDMIKRGRLEALTNFLDKYGPEIESGLENSIVKGEGPDAVKKPWGSLPDWLISSSAEFARAPTLLHLASAADQPLIVRYFLETKRADPTVQACDIVSSPSLSTAASSSSSAPISSATPYDLAPSRSTRNQFRFLAHSHPEWHDWLGAAHIPSGLDEAKEVEKERKEAEKKAKLREKQLAREAEENRIREAEEQEKEAKERREREEREEKKRREGRVGPQRLGGLGGAVKGQMAARERGGLSEEQRMRVEREERARAAEARLRRLGG